VDEAMSCADVPNPGRDGFKVVLPDPWRCYALAAKLGVQGPMGTTIRVSTTTYGIEEGLNAGMWTVALSTTGLIEAFKNGAESDERRKKRVANKFWQLGCHYVIDGPADLPATVEAIEARMSAGETP
jgi:phosphonoacetaldehyde hydrolase